MKLAAAALLGLVPVLAATGALAQTGKGTATALPKLPPASGSAAPGAGSAAATAGAPGAGAPGAGAGSASPGVTLSGAAAPSASWEARYAAAGRAMLEGHFDSAIVEYTDLVRTAPTPVARTAALGQLGIASAHASGSSLAAPPAGAVVSTLPLPPKTPDPERRSTDEIVSLYVFGAQGYGIVTGLMAAVLADSGSATLLGLGIAGASAGAIAFADLHHAFRYGAAEAVTSGFLVGTAAGLGFGLWDGNHIYGVDSSYGVYSRSLSASHPARRAVAWTFTMSSAGIVSGAVAAAIFRTTPGRSHWVAATALTTGLVAGGIAGGATTSSDYTDRDPLSSFALGGAIGSLGGAAVGVLTASVVSPRISRVRYVDLAWLSGGIFALGACTQCNTEERFGALAAGTGGGFLAGMLITLGMSKEPLPKRPTSDESQAAILPYAAPTAGGVQVGLGGLF